MALVTFWKITSSSSSTKKAAAAALLFLRNKQHHTTFNNNKNSILPTRGFQNQKLDKQNQKSLDPLRNPDNLQHHYHLHLYQTQGTTTSKHVVQPGEAHLEEEEEEENQQQPPKKRTTEHASKMGESSSSHQNRPIPSSRLGIGLRNSGGEIVEVQGGHIVRSTGRKDRHSKVCTAKGPRDRRVRLAAHTAIQFYDVQDRLGYDRPSKAVDWLIKKAKSAIDELAELPAWNPMTTCSAAPNAEDIEDNSSKHQQDQHQNQQQLCMGGNEMMIVNVQQQENANNSSFLPPSLDSDAIADTIKSFFPMGAASSSSSAMQFQSFQTPPDLRQNQDLRLSLQSFQDPVYPTHHNSNSQPHSHVLLSGTPLGFDGGWQEHQAELSRFQRFAAWNNAGGDAGSSGSGGYLFNLPPVGASVPQQQVLSSHNQFFSSQRGPLQSSNTPSVRAWMDPTMIANAMADHSNSHQQQQQQQHHLHPSAVPIYPSSFSGIGGFSGFHIPARIQGDEEEHDGYSDKPSSASSDSRH